MPFSRRFFLGGSLTALSSGALAREMAGVVPSQAPVQTSGQVLATPRAIAEVSSALLQRALGALDQHRAEIPHRDFIGIADFSLPSSAPRFHVVNLGAGSATSYLVAHGRGSDPLHTGWLERFSNDPGSFATSSGAYLTGDLYTGAHGHSMRLDGLDPTNSNALARAIVVHAAWYVSQYLIGVSGMLGRSEGCLAVASSKLGEILTTLGPGRMIYADKA